MRAKYVNEKFIEDSDPVHDMGIGILPLLTKEWIKLQPMTTHEIYLENFLKVKFDTYSISTNTVAAFYYNLIKRLKEEGYEEDDFQKAFDTEIYNFKRALPYTEDSQGLSSIIIKAAKIVDEKFGIKLKIQ